MYTNMTRLSRKAYDAALDEMLTVHDAVRFLEEELKTRSLKSKIEKFSGKRKDGELKEYLVDGLLENHPERSISRQSIEKKVGIWLDGKGFHSIKKATAIELSFILGLTLEKADDFVALVSGERLHWRSAREIVYIYALKEGLTYLEAAALYNKMKDSLKKVRDSKKVHTAILTCNVRRRVEMIRSEKELEDFIRDESELIGNYHNQAYRAFMDMLEILQNPVSEEEADRLWEKKKETLTIRDILMEYLFQNNVLYARKKAVETKKKRKAGEIGKEDQFTLSKIQKEVANSWPEETVLSKMRQRKADVGRKVLILLFLATYQGEGLSEGGFSVTTTDDIEYRGLERDELSREQIFRSVRDNLNYLLNLCGFAGIDPRSPFDWLVLYSICAGDLLEMDGRLRQIFLEMFGEDDDVREQDLDLDEDPDKMNEVDEFYYLYESII